MDGKIWLCYCWRINRLNSFFGWVYFIPARRAPKASPADLLGSDAARIDTLLGAPEIVRREGPGELRLYRSTTCVLHVFLYPGNGAIRATHIEARTATVRLAAGETNSCVASFS